MATIDKRTTRDGRVRWRARVRRRGVRESQSFASRAQAVRWASEVERAIARGEWSTACKSGDLRLEQLIAHYHVAEASSVDTRRQLGWWNHRVGFESAESISRRRILSLREVLRREEVAPGRRRRPATVNRYVSALSALYTFGLRRGWVDHHPVRGIAPLSEGESRVRFLDDEEKDRLLDACVETGGGRLQALVTLGLVTGARRGELLELCWSDIDLRQGMIVVGRSSRRAGRSLPLPADAIETLRPLAKVRRIGGDEVFADRSGRVGFPRREWEAALRRAEIDDFRFHDLRHTAAAYLAQAGATLADIAEFLGHKTLQGVQRYAHLTDQSSRRGIARLHDRLFRSPS